MTPFWPDGRRVEVKTIGDIPHTLHWRGDDHPLEHLSTRWRVHTRWWLPEEVWRDYWEVTTESGFLCVLYRELLHDEWYLERVYD